MCWQMMTASGLYADPLVVAWITGVRVTLVWAGRNPGDHSFAARLCPRRYLPVLAPCPGHCATQAPFRDWVMPAALERHSATCHQHSDPASQPRSDRHDRHVGCLDVATRAGRRLRFGKPSAKDLWVSAAAFGPLCAPERHPRRESGSRKRT
jgi:hypothetical protein